MSGNNKEEIETTCTLQQWRLGQEVIEPNKTETVLTTDPTW